ncbi:hypothetical protein QTP88_009762 [Uroleucon formosanum]
MAYKMFSTGLVVLAFVGLSLCQQLQQFNAGLPSQYLPSTMSPGSFPGSSAALQQVRTKFEDNESQSDKLSSSNLEVSQQSQSYQDAVQQQNLAQSYQTAFENTGVPYSSVTPNSYRGNQDSQQYYVPATQQSAEPQFITKESYSAVVPAVIPAAIPAQAQPDSKQLFTTPTQSQQDFSAANAAQAQQEYRHHEEYRHQHLAAIAQAQVEYKKQVAALEQAQLEYKQQFTSLNQAQQVLNHQFAAPVQAQQELKKQSNVLEQAQKEYNQQFSDLVQAQKEYKQQFAALNEAQQELKQQFAAPVQAQQELKQQFTVLAQAQNEFNKQFSALAQAQQEYKQQFADLAQAQLEFRQQFATLIQAQKELKQQFVATNQIPHEYKQRFTGPAQQVYRQQYAVPDQGRPDYRQRFVTPTPAYVYIQKSTAATATGPNNYSYVAQNPATQIKFQTVSAVQPKFQYAANPQQYYNTVPTVTEQPRVQQSATNKSLSGVVISTTPTSSVVYKSQSTPTPRQ